MNHQIKRASMALLLSVFCFVAYAQKTITGTVKDASGEPMIGVSVIVDGTTIGGVTDFDGNFTIQNVSEKAVLKISYIGFKEQKISVAGKNSFNVTMQEDAAALDEVVVVGYGTMKKKDLTGSVASVKTEDLAKVAGANALSAMQAKVPGVDLQQSGGGEAGAGVSMTLRGNRSLLAGNGPLVIVDGVEYGSTLDIPATDIESMDILKDAASTAIYGTKGANGVILITTKRGSAGKTKVNFNGYLSFNGATGIVKPMYGDKEVQRLIDKKNYETAAANDWNFTNTATAADVLTFTLDDLTETLDIYNNKSYTDWLDMILDNSVSQNYEVSVQGGNEKTNFNVSLSAMDDKGLMKGDEYNRYTGRANIDHQINRIVKIGASLSYAYKSNDKRNGGVYNQAQKMTTITHAYLNDGEINYQPNPWYSAHCSPLLDENGAYQKNIESTRFFGSGYLQLNPIKGLTLKSQFTADRSESRTGSYEDYQCQSRYQENKGSYISNSRSVSTKYVWQNTANYNKTIGKHDMTFLLGHEMSQSVSESLSIAGYAGYEHYYTSSFYDVSKIDDPSKSSGYTKTSMLSFFGRANYSFDGKYLLQASVRADGSSVLAEGHKWGFFPSVSAGWRISEEGFMKNTKSWLDNLKFRVSWGLSGNSAISAYQTLATIKSIVPNSTDKAPMTMANPNLTWEKTAALDFGLDFSFLNGRIYGSIDYYNSKTYDLLYYKTAPASSVFTSTISNVGKTKGHGLEISLGAVPVKTDDFTWDLSASATFARDEVSELADGIEQVVSGTSILKIGEPVSAYYTYDMDGCWGIGEFEKYMAEHPNFVKPFSDYGDPGTPKVIDTNGDDQIDDNDKIVYNRSPKAILGLSTSFTYKDFSLSIQTMARLGGYLNYSGYGLYLYDNANWGDLSYWTPDNQGADIPSPGCAGSTPTYFKSAIQIQKADYFKIKDITLAYNLPKSLIKKAYISNARVYCSLKNYFTFSHFDNYDPERGGSVNFPLMKQVVVGLNVTF
ncbi:TonB-linked outer membrane protein, SusC/RagA family [Xylanibacter ruminicola]|uniref:TonB-linked outer membrane protein, SusC/RagA family n=1 Tax=Xylanibacter ruminicola TaxID=839 RepID=A0A1H4CMU2_XYLRU|nr:TonB-dependent receptor [Xylanibacter ruminicola]SEA61647.1 TonB-linked outer membrane protein, SusC/RagA family [Xylanibacter ruminicola]